MYLICACCLQFFHYKLRLAGILKLYDTLSKQCQKSIPDTQKTPKDAQKLLCVLPAITAFII